MLDTRSWLRGLRFSAVSETCGTVVEDGDTASTVAEPVLRLLVNGRDCALTLSDKPFKVDVVATPCVTAALNGELPRCLCVSTFNATGDNCLISWAPFGFVEIWTLILCVPVTKPGALVKLGVIGDNTEGTDDAAYAEDAGAQVRLAIAARVATGLPCACSSSFQYNNRSSSILLVCSLI